jgi:hypothetical protein
MELGEYMSDVLDLTVTTTPALTDVVYVVVDPGGTPLDRQSTLQSVANLITATPYTSKTANYTATATDEFIAVDATAGAVTIALPAVASTRVGKVYSVKKVDASGNAASLNPNASETIDGSATTLDITTQWQSITILNTGAGWLVVSEYVP